VHLDLGDLNSRSGFTQWSKKPGIGAESQDGLGYASVTDSPQLPEVGDSQALFLTFALCPSWLSWSPSFLSPHSRTEIPGTATVWDPGFVTAERKS